MRTVEEIHAELTARLRAHGVELVEDGRGMESFEAEGRVFTVTPRGWIMPPDDDGTLPVVGLDARPDAHPSIVAHRTRLLDDLWAVTFTDEWSLVQRIDRIEGFWELDWRVNQPWATGVVDMLVRYGEASVVDWSSYRERRALIRVEGMDVVVEEVAC